MVDVDRDGNCQFHAIADQLEGNETHTTVRAKVVQTLRECRANGTIGEDLFHAAAVTAPTEYKGNVDDYLNGLEDNEWGDQLTLIGASIAYGVGINYITTQGDSEDDGGFRALGVPTSHSGSGQTILLGHEGERHWTSMQCNLPSARPWGKKKGSFDSATDEEKEEAEHADLLAKLRRKWTRGLLLEEQIQQLPARLVEQWEEKRGEGSQSVRRANNTIAALCSIDRALDTARRDYVSASKYLEGFCSRSMLTGDRWKGLTDTRKKKIEALKRILETEGNSLSEKKKKKIEAALERYKRAEEALKRFVNVETLGGSGSLKDIADSVAYRVMEANTGMYEVSWEKMFQLVKEYKEEHGGEEWDGNVPFRYSVTLNDGTEANVGRWVTTQKQKRKKRLKDGSDTIESPVEKRLTEIGILWEVVTNRTIGLEEYIAEIVEYKKKWETEHPGKEWDGHVPGKYSVTLNDGTKANVGRWLDAQKQKRKKRLNDRSNTTESPEEKRLNEIGILWEVRKK